jgi:hypothetical protein
MITAIGIKNCNPYDTKIANMYISFTDMYKVSSGKLRVIDPQIVSPKVMYPIDPSRM